MKNGFDRIYQRAEELQQQMTEWRRDFHRYPETGWMEMRTSALIANELKKIGYEVLTGRSVCDANTRMAVPESGVLEQHFERVTGLLRGSEAADFLDEDLKEGFTGVVGILHCGQGGQSDRESQNGQECPVIALRFDIDALPMTEAADEEHRPFREGFSSEFSGMMHACGHDCHAAIGLGTARILAEMREELHGTVKLLFQPAEEGTRGAAAMTAAGHLEGVTFFAGTHVAPDNGPDDGDITPGSYGSLATSKYNVYLHGRSAHAGGVPEQGRNAILAAAHAVVGLAGISRHSGGMSRVNVGVIQGGSASNVVADSCMFSMEVRGATTEINDYMAGRAQEICQAAAMMEGCSCEMELRGRAPSQNSSPELVKRIADVVSEHLPQVRVSSGWNPRNLGSEDIGFMMDRVQEQGGQAVYMRSVTRMASPQHTVRFDVEESVLKKSAAVFSALVYDLLKGKEKC